MSLIAIDGRAGAGKTTLAAALSTELSQKHSVALIHMDDLYEGWNNALGIHLSQTLETIVKAHQLNKTIEIKIFNWESMTFDSTQRIEPVEILILEGVGAGQKVVREAGAIVHWLDIDPEIGIARVLKRDGNQIAKQMKQWQIDQELHFMSDKTRENAQHFQSS